MDTAKKVLKIVFKILYQLLIIMCVLLTLIIVFQKFSDNNKSIGGYRIFRVITGSMVPEYDIGEVVISKEIDTKKIKVGDDIVYLGNYGEYSGKIIMHQVTKIDENEDGSLTFHAKGLFVGSVEDPLIRENQIYGVVKIKSGILTLLYKWATSIYSAFIIISVLVLNVFISFKFPGKGSIEQLDENVDDEDEEEYDDDEYDDDDEDYDDDDEYDEEDVEEEDDNNSEDENPKK